jgi:hypothetical protein
MNQAMIRELLLQSLEAEIGGVQVYETALTCAVHPELVKEWEEYLGETREHVKTVQRLCEALDIDPETETPGRAVVRHLGASLVKAMEMARETGDPDAAQIVACECVVLAETKDHADWELIGQVAKNGADAATEQLLAAYEKVEDQEDSHLYHSRGWCRELWVQSLGLDAVLPPPEETLQVKTAIGAARAQASVRAARRVGATEPRSAQ